MHNERQPTLRQADQARTDFAAIESDLEAIYARLARMPNRAGPRPHRPRHHLLMAIITTLFQWVIAH
jgi:hypothetical protein